MSTKLFVGNLSFNTTENDLQEAFAAHGSVVEANLMMDRMTVNFGSRAPRGAAALAERRRACGNGLETVPQRRGWWRFTCPQWKRKQAEKYDSDLEALIALGLLEREEREFLEAEGILPKANAQLAC